MMFKQRIIYIFVLAVTFTNSVKDNGEFDLTITNFKRCKGPKRKECCIISEQAHNGTHLKYEVEVPENVFIETGNVLLEREGNLVARFQMKKPCDHFIVGPVFKEIMNLTNDCIINKGHYLLFINLEAIAQKSYGGIFLYGNVTFKTVFYNRNCNYICEIIEVKIFPKT